MPSISKNTFLLTSAYIFQKIFAFVYFTILARWLGAEDIGKYTFAIAFCGIASVFIDLGLTNVLIREIAKFKDKAKAYLANILGLKLILGFFIYLVVIFLINLWNYPVEVKMLVYIIGFNFIVDSFVLSFFGFFRSFHNLKYESLAIIINQLVIVAVGLIGVVLDFPLYVLGIALLAGTLFNFVFCLYVLKKKFNLFLSFRYEKDVVKLLCKMAVPFALMAIFARVYSSIDQVLLSRMVGDVYVGWYGVPYKLTFAFQFIPAAFSASLYPVFSTYYQNDQKKIKETFERVLFFLIVLSLPMVFGIISLARELILNIYTVEYLPSIFTLQILIIALFFQFVSYPVGSLLNGCNRQKENTINMGIGMVVNIILNIILIPYYQHLGAAIAAVVTMALMFFLNFIWVNKITPVNYKFILVKFLKALSLSILMALVIFGLKPYINFVALIFIGAGVYVGGMFLVKGFVWQDINRIIQALRKKEV